ncbi:hypothetical protein TVAG_362430 [Trichomonas vaginalis G3]|uniref:Uncharacterized protein n=1 Tax=Trichomonas vaginalis (strain ATCC PRA-98 / G3) TaxID=412133 RepID=A2E621_TRIV3|nr:hypothetical protein TVAGG3_0366000 [Trichomonas vaginalis G3]EAY11863.1 hypothetical protein TVAG_362430 [Trichomonas vaginalis G3]KAI5532273.1 hypothetical protein TVAGG3_0366000 [Trichomonas vaginalis G3]|eukprot:XP_001324086.1 hypothetical protein [Trichomonas vaginalis G3]
MIHRHNGTTGNNDMFQDKPQPGQSLPVASWNSLPNIPVQSRSYKGCFHRDPQNIAMSLKRPSAPNNKPTFVLPAGRTFKDFEPTRRNSISHSKSCDDISRTHC